MARTLLVSPGQPGAFATISDAVASAGPDTVVSVAPGEYPETVRLEQLQRVTVSARDPGTVTLTSPDPDLPTVAIVDSEVTLVGLVVTATEQPAIHVRGGRVRIDRCRATTHHTAAVEILDGAVAELGDTEISQGRYGLVVHDADAVVTRCQVRDVADDGVIVRLGAHAVLQDCLVTGCGFRGVYLYQAGGSAWSGARCRRPGTPASRWPTRPPHHQRLLRSRHRGPRGGGRAGLRRAGGGLSVENTASPSIQLADGARTTVRTGDPAWAGRGTTSTAGAATPTRRK